MKNKDQKRVEQAVKMYPEFSDDFIVAIVMDMIVEDEALYDWQIMERRDSVRELVRNHKRY